MSSRYRHLMLVAACAVCVTVLTGCQRDKSKTPAIGTAFAGPITLGIHEEISPASKVIATVKHGEKLEVLQVRRRFVRVRTSNGQEGWTTSRNLLSSRQMDDLEELSKRSAKLPVQGEATVYGTLNMHIEPFRAATSFYQITEGDRVQVLGHRITPKTATPESSGNTLELKKRTPPPRKRKKQPDYPPPDRPAPPGVPENWMELSKTRLPEPPPPPPDDPNDTKKKKRRRPKPTGPPMEDWTLVRTKDGRAGWALSKMLVMAIPDEVAQYSEGARITSYFPLAEVWDDGVKRHHWLWTTVREDGLPYDFQSFRVFTWVLKRHRYETSYIERNIEGYFPVEVTPGQLPKFSLILRGTDGKLYKKTWVLEGYMTRKIAEELYTPPTDDQSSQSSGGSLTDKIRSLLDQ